VVELYKKVQDCDIQQESISKSFKQMNYTILKDLTKTRELIKDCRNDTGITELWELTQTISSTIRQSLYFPAQIPTLNGVKSDIRSLKGIFLSRRNFPLSGTSQSIH
jgi:hypothetical protein